MHRRRPSSAPPGDENTEVRLDTVAEIIVDHAVVLEDRSRKGLERAIQPAHQFVRREPLGDRREAAKVEEQRRRSEALGLERSMLDELGPTVPQHVRNVCRNVRRKEIVQHLSLPSLRLCEVSGHESARAKPREPRRNDGRPQCARNIA